MRSVDIIVRDTLGNQAIQIIQLQAQVESLEARVKELESFKTAEIVEN